MMALRRPIVLYCTVSCALLLVTIYSLDNVTMLRGSCRWT